MRMKADDEECLTAEAQRKVWIARIGTDPPVGRETPPNVFVCHRLDAFPHRGFEPRFIEVVWPFKNDSETTEQAGATTIGSGPATQFLMNAKVIPRTADGAADDPLQRAATKCRFCADTRKIRVANKLLKGCLQVAVGMMPNVEGMRRNVGVGGARFRKTYF